MAAFFSRLFPFRRPKKVPSEPNQQASDHISEVSRLLSLVSAAHDEGVEARTALAAALYTTGLERLDNGFPGEAAEALAAAVGLGCAEDYVHYNLALAFSRSGQALAAHNAFLRAMNEQRRLPDGDSYFVRNLHTLQGITLDDLKNQALAWSDRHGAKELNQSSQHLKTPSLPIKVGFLSGRFCRHAVGFLTLGGLEQLSTDRFEIILYDNGSPQDDFSTRFHDLASAVHNIAALSDDEAATLIHSHDLHLLVDMGGHSAGGRLGVMARKPAPVQVKWAGGQHGTTGLAQIDYFLTDPIETPPDHDPFFVEQPVRLPHSYAIYTPPADAPAVNALPCLSNGFVTFGCFNNIAKVSDRTIETWSKILNATPNSRLVLKHLALAEEVTRNRVAAQFSAFGISPTRLELRPPSDQIDHLRAYHNVDMALDPFPWSGCVTTCESLWMGVPVLALPGVAFCHRHSASFLAALDLDDWISSDAEDYASKAINFAQSPKTLGKLREALRSRMQTSPLCDAQAFASDLEESFLAMVRRNV